MEELLLDLLGPSFQKPVGTLKVRYGSLEVAGQQVNIKDILVAPTELRWEEAQSGHFYTVCLTGTS